MTPEDVEARLQSLRTPAPPERLRERCLRPGSTRQRAAFAIAASFLVVALSVWLIATQKPSVLRSPERVLPPAAELTSFTDDPVLKDKVERLLGANPGKGVLVVRVKERRGGTLLPVTKDFALQLCLEPADKEPDPKKESSGPRAAVDLDGTLLFVLMPGRYRGDGYLTFTDGELDKLHFLWEYKDVELKPGQALLLADALFVPRIEWSTPGGAALPRKADAKISWVPYPELSAIEISIRTVENLEDGREVWTTVGELKRDCPKEHAVSLSEVLKVCRDPVRAGEKLDLILKGFGRDGKELSGTGKLRIRIQE
jgi:hypothetical protein